MSATQFYPPMSQAGQYPQPGSYPSYGYQNHNYSPPAQQYAPQQSFQQNPPYPMQDPPYPQHFPGEQPPPYPQQFPGERPSYPQQQSFQPGPPHAGGFHSHPPAQTWDPQQVWAEQNGVSAYNNPSQPMYGKVPGEPDNFNNQLSRSGNPDQMQAGPDGERGLGATLIGGAGGAFLGHKMEHGALGTLGGLAIGAIAANAFEHHEKKKKEERRDVREYDDGYEAGERRHSHSRGIDEDRDRDSYYQDDRYRDYEEDYYEPPHHHHHHHHYQDDDGYYQDDYNQDYRREEYDRY